MVDLLICKTIIKYDLYKYISIDSIDVILERVNVWSGVNSGYCQKVSIWYAVKLEEKFCFRIRSSCSSFTISYKTARDSNS